MARLERVLLINYEYPPLGAGAGNATAHIARELVRAGTRTRVLTTRWRGLPARASEAGVEVVRVPARRRRVDRSSPLEMLSFLAGALGPAREAATQFRPQACCAFFSLPSGPLALLLRRQYGIPYLVSLRGGDVPGFWPAALGRWHLFTRPLIRVVWRHAAALVANSAGLAALARQTMPAAPLHIIPNGVDLTEFAPRPDEDERFLTPCGSVRTNDERPGIDNRAGDPADELAPSSVVLPCTPVGCEKRATLGVEDPSSSSAPVRLLFVGRCVEQKGLPVLLDALGRLRATRGLPPVQLDVVGDGPRRQAWQAQAGRLGLADQVQFHGWAARPALPAWYRRAHLFVFPSFEEGMPNALLEALASGLPLLATDIYGNRALVRPGENGLLVPPGDAAAFAQALATLLADPAGRAAMGQASRRLAVPYGWAAVAAAYHALLRAAHA
jgi:glycosyltransferase involved in cell wall biosynthesis